MMLIKAIYSILIVVVILFALCVIVLGGASVFEEDNKDED